MNQEMWDDRLCRERRQSIQERMELESRRFRQTERTAAKLTEVSAQMAELIKIHKEQLDDHAKRLRELEKAPGKLGEIAKTTAVSAIVSGLIAYLISVLF